LSVGMFWERWYNYGTQSVAFWTGGKKRVGIFIELKPAHCDSCWCS
jgi:hypothetical protein